MIKRFHHFFFNTMAKNSGGELESINDGYATLEGDGIFLKDYKNKFEKYRI